ncbi:hypothetical protein AB1Y20_018820 [Prymnesium parvum]|uniref:Exonuclease 1 n=1 Tax=Prymnesium parvum TaxID=97485 RepID=A0AB34JR79_PRYPA
MGIQGALPPLPPRRNPHPQPHFPAVHGLLPFLDGAAVPVHVSTFAGQRCAIDGYAWLHRGAKACALEMVKGMRCDAFVQYCMRLVELLVRNGLTPLVVFDGARLPAKAATEEARHASRARAVVSARELLSAGQRDRAMELFHQAVDVTPAHAKQLILALRSRGVESLVAPYEADAQMALLARRGDVHLVVTEDSDLLAFGCPAVLYKMDREGNGRLLRRDDLASLRACNSEQGALLFSPWQDWDERLFLDMCILSGCDYLPSLHGVGLKTAHRLLKRHGSAERVVRVLQMEGKESPQGGFDVYLAQLRRARETFHHQRVYDPLESRVLPLTPPPEGAPPMPHCGADLPAALAVEICERASRHPQTHEPLYAPGEAPLPEPFPLPASRPPDDEAPPFPAEAATPSPACRCPVVSPYTARPLAEPPAPFTSSPAAAPAAPFPSARLPTDTDPPSSRKLGKRGAEPMRPLLQPNLRGLFRVPSAHKAPRGAGGCRCRYANSSALNALVSSEPSRAPDAPPASRRPLDRIPPPAARSRFFPGHAASSDGKRQPSSTASPVAEGERHASSDGKRQPSSTSSPVAEAERHASSAPAEQGRLSPTEVERLTPSTASDGERQGEELLAAYSFSPRGRARGGAENQPPRGAAPKASPASCHADRRAEICAAIFAEREAMARSKADGWRCSPRAAQRRMSASVSLDSFAFDAASLPRRRP